MWISREHKHSVHSEHPTPLGTWKRVLAPVCSSSVPFLGCAFRACVVADVSLLWPVEESGGRYNGAGIPSWFTRRDLCRDCPGGRPPAETVQEEGRANCSKEVARPRAELKGHQDSIALKKTNWCRFFLFS